ncbi:hypothetical protein, partial [Acidovorax sp.]|uniref:hypothetical protein n=1 Tax=Acidovorax sp. TaxID=1872122 RepID=UPI0025C1D077
LSLLDKRRLYFTLTPNGGLGLSQKRSSLQNKKTEDNKPIQIQNRLAKSATCAACIDMDRSFFGLQHRSAALT